MQRFSYTAIDINKKKYKGEFLASDEKHLRQLLSAQDLFLVSCKVSKSSGSNVGGFFSLTGSVKKKEVTLFCKQFSVMIGAGIDIVTSLETLQNQPTYSKALKLVLQEMLNDITAGKTLCDAMRIHKKVFPEFFVSMVNVGEESGSLDVVLIRLAEYYENQQATKAKVMSELSYPIILVVLAIGVVLALSLFIIPTFVEAFDKLDSELPKLTQVIFAVSNFMIDNILYIGAIALGVVVVIVGYGRTKSGKFNYDAIKANTPMIKGVVQSRFASRFARSFAILLASGMPVVDSMEILANLLGNKYFEKKFRQSIIDVKQGVSLSTTFARSQIFPPILLQMVMVGEQSGTLDNILDSTSDFFDEQLNTSIKRATGMIQPILLVFIAGVVLCVLLGIFLPIMNLSSSIGAEADTGMINYLISML
ncbi:MAG: type II secretion system F family protein [Clostridia bacterium]|nr:type II secretion system F family protein [Clostridia bacterium]